MHVSTLLILLEEPALAGEHLRTWGLNQPQCAAQLLIEWAEAGLPLAELAIVCGQLQSQLPDYAPGDALVEGLRRFVQSSSSPLALGAQMTRDASILPMLLAAMNLGQGWRDLLVQDPAAFDRLRATAGQPISRERLVDEIGAEVRALVDERPVAAALARWKARESLRIAYGEVVLRQRFELVAEQLTALAEAVLESALRQAQRKLQTQATNRNQGGLESPVSLIALGRLGGREMDYAGVLELLLVYDPRGESDIARHSRHEHLERMARNIAKLLADPATGQPTYAVRWIALPDGSPSAMAHTADDTLLGFDSFGRTWHRQALIRARPVAGDRGLGAAVLRRLEPWLYRRYLNRADETGIKALRRRILRRQDGPSSGLAESPGRASAADALSSDLVELARGGLADIEAVVQFLQLLMGGEKDFVRTGSVLAAIAALEQAEALTVPERNFLTESYIALRQKAHQLQIRVGSAADGMQPTRAAPANECLLDPALLAKTWDVLSRLLDAAIVEEAPPAAVDLLLDSDSPEEAAAEALAGYGFARPAEAATMLRQLAAEPVPFLSTRRSRHFLSLIVERLLMAIGSTPDPDGTLANLSRVSDSLGAKGVLWELFHFHPASLHLYVRMCAASPYLSGILTTNPGIIDDLVDSLQLDLLPNLEVLSEQFHELARGSAEPLDVVRDLKNASHLRIGVRDILGQEPIENTHRALADVAEFCLAAIAEREYGRLVEKFGRPTIGLGPFEGEPCRPLVLALGKLGKREPNYHSSVDVVFLYEAEGNTRLPRKTRPQDGTTNNHFFTQLAQRVIKELTALTPKGRLYDVDAALRPIGVGGALALPLSDFVQHFASGAAPLWQWQALLGARPVVGEPAMRASAGALIGQLLATRPWHDQELQKIVQARLQLEQGAGELNMKRGPGGTLDVEVLVQMLQLRHASQSAGLLGGGTLATLAELARAGHLEADDSQFFAESYRLLRRVESGLRLLNTPSRHELPEDQQSLGKLAILLNHPSPAGLKDRVIIALAENRRRWQRLMGLDA